MGRFLRILAALAAGAVVLAQTGCAAELPSRSVPRFESARMCPAKPGSAGRFAACAPDRLLRT